MDRFVNIGRWLDCYGSLLTDRQQSIMSQYAFENCSLSEIAEREGISRQGVRDIIVRSELQLENYEARLHNAQNLFKLNHELQSLRRLAQKLSIADCDRAQLLDTVGRIEKIWEEDNGI